MDTKTLTVLDFAKPPASFLHFLVTCILLACLWNKYNHCHLLLNKQPSELLSDGKVTKTQRLKQGQIMHNAQYKCYTAGKQGEVTQEFQVIYFHFAILCKIHKSYTLQRTGDCHAYTFTQLNSQDTMQVFPTQSCSCQNSIQLRRRQPPAALRIQLGPATEIIQLKSTKKMREMCMPAKKALLA